MTVQELRKRIMFRLDDGPDWLYALHGPIQRAICLLAGHVPISDQCNMPDHDYCAFCLASTPGAADRRAEGKA